jgi:hypothetical protein
MARFVVPEQEDDRDARLIAFVVAPDIATETVLKMLRLSIDRAFLLGHFIL